MRALVVDDSKAMRSIVGRIVKQLGFELREAVHGKDALEQLRAAGTMDLVLVDWNMPEMNGYEFVRAVRSEPAFDELRIMMITTEAALPQMAQALEAGANEYLIKPFTAEALRGKLEMIGLQLE